MAAPEFKKRVGLTSRHVVDFPDIYGIDQTSFICPYGYLFQCFLLQENGSYRFCQHAFSCTLSIQ